MSFVGPKWLTWLTKVWMPLGKRIVIIGGAIHGCELAEFPVKRSRHVTIVESSETIGGEMVVTLAQRLVRWLKSKGVRILSEVSYDEVTDTGLTITHKDGRKETLEADNILIALPLSANTDLYHAIDGKCAEVHSVGDCREPHHPRRTRRLTSRSSRLTRQSTGAARDQIQEGGVVCSRTVTTHMTGVALE